MAKLATEINRDVENIGCRRLHTIMERIMEVYDHPATPCYALLRVPSSFVGKEGLSYAACLELTQSAPLLCAGPFFHS